MTGRTKQAKAQRERHARAVAFFMEHAGYSYDPEALATAEEYAFNHSLEYRWADDWSVDHQKEFDCYEDGGPETCEYCQLIDVDGKVLASLGCIDDATASYRRVIEAELALEAMAA